MRKINLEKSKDGFDILCLNLDGRNVYLGSKYNTRKDIERLLTSIKDNVKKVVIFGLGSGSYIDELSKYNKGKDILIVEPNKEVITLFNKRNKVKYDNVNIKSLEEVMLNQLLDDYCETNNQFNFIGEFSNYINVYSNIYLDLLKEYKDIYVRKNISDNTKVKYAKTFFKTSMNSIKALKDCRYVNEYKDILKGRPAVIISAGPSLTKNIQDLGSASPNIALIPSGRTVGKLLDMGIEPAIYVVGDPSEAAYNVVKDYLPRISAPLVCYEKTSEGVVREYKNEKIFFAQNKELNNLIGIETKDLISGGSVAHTSVEFALYMGCNPIIFIGQDCAYTDEKLYADIVDVTKENIKGFEDKEVKNAIYVDAVGGGKVRTEVDLNTFRLEMEEIIEINPKTKFINATEGGAAIRSAEEMTLIEALGKYGNDKEDVNKIIRSNNRRIESKSRKTRIKTFIEDYINAVEEIIKLCDEGDSRSELSILNFKKTDNLDSDLKMVFEIKEKIDSVIISKEMIKNMLFPVLKEFNQKMDEISLDDGIIVFEIVQNLYRKIRADMEFALEILDEVKQEL